MVGNLAYNICISVSIASAAISVAGESVSTNSVDSASNVPRILLDEGTFNGIRNDSIDRFLGIQYAKPTYEQFLPILSHHMLENTDTTIG